MANTIGSTAYGPSWRDVGDMLERLQTKWGGAWFVQLTGTYSRVSRGSLSVVCKRLRAGRQPGTTDEYYVSETYPRNDYANLTECVFKLLHRADAELEERKEQAERQMTF